MASALPLLVLVVLLALAFDYINGFHDTANAVATVVSTNVLPGRTAVLLAALFHFVGAFVGVGVAKTIGDDITDPRGITQTVIASALLGAILWNLLTWYYGIPSSSSHALVGGIIGAGVAKAGVGKLVASGVLKTAAAIVVSPLFGFALAIALMIAVSWIFVRSTPRRIDRWFQRLQFVSAALYSLGHGGNDAQKTMGIIWMLLIASGLSAANEPLPFWVVLACQAAMGLGTLFGGWRIVKTMGMRITKLKPVGGFCASASGAMTLFLATSLGIPVSTTHTITGSIIGVGSTQKLSAVRWGVAGNIVWAWIFTIPGSAFIAGVAWLLGTEYF